MADEVQEQMGDILSAYGIPELAKDIYAIPLERLDPEDDKGEAEPERTKPGGGGDNKADGETKSPNDRESKFPEKEAEDEGSSKIADADNASEEKNDGMRNSYRMKAPWQIVECGIPAATPHFGLFGRSFNMPHIFRETSPRS